MLVESALLGIISNDPRSLSLKSSQLLHRAAYRDAYIYSMRIGAPTLLGNVLCSMLALGFLAARVVYTDRGDMEFLAFNLLLAWIPMGCALLAAQRPNLAAWKLGALGVVWLLFFPNAPYLVTDFVHLRPRVHAPLWFDVAMLASFAWCGMLLGCSSLSVAHRIARERAGAMTGWLFVIGVALLSGLGIYLGRFVRLNSWDVFVDPLAALAIMQQSIAAEPARALGVTLAFGALVGVAHLSFQPLRQSPARRSLAL